MKIFGYVSSVLVADIHVGRLLQHLSLTLVFLCVNAVACCRRIVNLHWREMRNDYCGCAVAANCRIDKTVPCGMLWAVAGLHS